MPQVNEESNRKFKAVVTWEDTAINSSETKEDAAIAFKETVNDSVDEIIIIESVENIEEL